MRRVALLGPEGTFSDIAARDIYQKAEFVYCEDIEAIFEKVVEGAVDEGFVPLENSVEGSVGQALDCLLSYEVYLTLEKVLSVELCLLSKAKRLEDVRCVVSHPIALAQCRRFLQKLGAKLQLASSTACAAELDERTAIVGHEHLSSLYALNILARAIQDRRSETRFVGVSKELREEGDKTSLIFAVEDKPGALCRVLEEFASRRINLKRIESRPSKRRLGEYYFFLDFEGCLRDKMVKEALNAIRPKVTYLKLLGSYVTSD